MMISSEWGEFWTLGLLSTSHLGVCHYVQKNATCKILVKSIALFTFKILETGVIFGGWSAALILSPILGSIHPGVYRTCF